jgi:hypothetical protein
VTSEKIATSEKTSDQETTPPEGTHEKATHEKASDQETTPPEGTHEKASEQETC